jgi:hypothetical protein
MGLAKTEIITIRCTTEEKELWQQKAGDVPVSRWARAVINHVVNTIEHPKRPRSKP